MMRIEIWVFTLCAAMLCYVHRSQLPAVFHIQG
jgi:hypothetical protein